MDFARQQLAVLQERLAGLGATQKMLVAALAVIAVMTMLYWGRAAGVPDRVALLPNALAADELATVTNALRARGIEYQVDAGKVMVSADRQLEAFSELSQNQALPANSANALDAMFDKVTPWSTQSDFNARLNNANQQQVSAIIKTWRGVKHVDVVIADASHVSLSKRDPRMSVSIQTDGRDVDVKRMALNARQFVKNCVTGLDTTNIGVRVDNYMLAGDGSENGGGMASGDAQETVRKFEADETEKLRGQLPQVPGMLVQVSAQIDTSTRTQTKHSIEPKVKLSEVTSSSHETSTPVGGVAPAAEPGVVANTVVSIAPAPAAVAVAPGIATDKLVEQTTLDYNKNDETINTPGGNCKIVGATVGLPHSYLVNIWRQKQAASADPNARPTDDDLQPILDHEVARLRKSVGVLTALDEKNLMVGDYWDVDNLGGGPVLAVAAAPGAASNLTAMAAGHARELALGTMTIVSLFMVGRMVKKSAPTVLGTPALAGLSSGGLGMMTAGEDVPIAAAATLGKAKSTTFGGEDVAGDVGEAGPVMFGHELDPDVLETSQIIEQVSGFVKQNPEVAAQMISRWMSRD